MTIFTLEDTKEVFELLESTKGVQQNLIWHPEGDVFEHSLQVVKHAFRETNDVDLILAALLHDVGKKEDMHEHEKHSCELVKDYVSVKTLFLIKEHRRIWYYLLGEMKKLSKCKELAEHPWLPELVQLARFDKKGRNPNVKSKYDKEDIIERLNKCAENHFYIPEGLKDEIREITISGIKERREK